MTFKKRDKNYLLKKYNTEIVNIKLFPVWTREQIKKFLHISNDTIQDLSDVGILKTFFIGKVKLYSYYDTDYSNEKILKSIMRIDSFYRLTYDYDVCVRDSDLDNKSLIARNVEMTHMANDAYKMHYYDLYLLNSISSVSQCKKVSKTVNDVFYNCPVNYVLVNVFVPAGSNVEMLKNEIENNPDFITINIEYYLYFNIIEVKNTAFSYIKI